jgi:predicted transcriptional regulator
MLLQLTLNILTKLKHKKKIFTSNLIKMIKDLNKSLKEIQKNIFKPVETLKEKANKYKEIQENTTK